ncbi:hypothetical protein C9F11_20130 [Streptomyces sp. YIM 121038]|uniref:hypothetical protein n=1 Tax=Streptomyces sp. YIM 121038 TaxID=2136401 RepID=UPI001110D217|nr:hypothetical protein [Streptomyces sp. YIM 121038]QCX77661.1 hypothetical protein C9F11_20130 [Streptomyces sp. YIM 121038]
MSEQPYVRNELSDSHIKGHVIQSGNIHGDVVINPEGTPLSQAEAEVQRRWYERQGRILDAEDAQRAESQRRAEQFVRHCRAKQRVNTVFMLIGLVTAVTAGLVHPGFVLLAILFGVPGAIGWVRYTRVVRKWDAGNAIKVPRSRLMW